MQEKNKVNFIFWGTPDVARDTLEILKQAGYTPKLIVTATDKPQGRKMLLTPPPVKDWAIENNIPFIQTDTLDKNTLSEISEKISNMKIQLSVVVAYGKIIPEKIINMPNLGSINIHYSLLPLWRGASPVESAVLNGDTETGVSIQQMEYKMDTGPLLAQEKTEILKDEKATELRKRLIQQGGELLVNILPDLIENKIKTKPQDHTKATYTKKLKKEDGLVDLEKETPKDLYNKFRAYSSWPRIFFFKNNKRVIITDATLETEEKDQNKQKFIIKKVLPEGKKEITWEDFLRNNK